MRLWNAARVLDPSSTVTDADHQLVDHLRDRRGVLHFIDLIAPGTKVTDRRLVWILQTIKATSPELAETLTTSTLAEQSLTNRATLWCERFSAGELEPPEPTALVWFGRFFLELSQQTEGPRGARFFRWSAECFAQACNRYSRGTPTQAASPPHAPDSPALPPGVQRTLLALPFEASLPELRDALELLFAERQKVIHAGGQTAAELASSRPMMRATQGSILQGDTRNTHANLEYWRRLIYDKVAPLLAKVRAPIESSVGTVRVQARRFLAELHGDFAARVMARLETAKADSPEETALVFYEVLALTELFHYPPGVVDAAIEGMHDLSWQLVKGGAKSQFHQLARFDASLKSGGLLKFASDRFIKEKRLLHLSREISQLLVFRSEAWSEPAVAVKDTRLSFDIDPTNINAQRFGAQVHANYGITLIERRGRAGVAEALLIAEQARKMYAKSAALKVLDQKLKRLQT